MFQLLSQSSSTVLDQFMNLGVAGIMGAMWLWERTTSRTREQQIDEAHARIMADRVQLDQLMDVVRHNTQVLTSLTEQLRVSAGKPS